VSESDRVREQHVRVYTSVTAHFISEQNSLHVLLFISSILSSYSACVCLQEAHNSVLSAVLRVHCRVNL